MRKLILVMTAAVLVAAPLASPASAHYFLECNRKLHDRADVKVLARLDHPSSGWYARGYVRTNYEGAWCTSVGEWHPATTDIYLATYADNLVDGSYSLCRKNVRGWRGGIPDSGTDWWVATIDQNALVNYCNWGQKRVRTRSLGKAHYRDGHVISVWTYTSAHASL